MNEQQVKRGEEWVKKHLYSSELFHYGVKGMKWGVRRTPEQLGHKKKIEKSIKSGILKSESQNNIRVEADIAKQRSASIKKGLRNLQARIEEHESKISNPSQHYPKWESFSELQKNGLIRHWRKEIRTFQKSIEARIDELKRRGDYHE